MSDSGYSNWDIQNNTEGSIQRQWNWGGVSKMEDPYLACGNNGVPHANSYYAPIVAGNIVTANYSLDTKSEEAERPWTFGHPYGAMLAYMAACPEEGCESVDLNAPIWFVSANQVPRRERRALSLGVRILARGNLLTLVSGLRSGRPA
jgi:hypothetical protein